MQLTDAGIAALRKATIADCMVWATAGATTTGAPQADLGDVASIVANVGTVGCPVFLALHPFGRLGGGDPSDPANWEVVGYEILARSRGGGNRFPFPMFAKMTREQRLAWTGKCALLSAQLKAEGIMAKFNVQACDYAATGTFLFNHGLTWNDVAYELAEYDQQDDGTIGLPPTKAPKLDAGILEIYREASLDDCGEGGPTAARSYECVLALVRKQDARIQAGSMEAPCFHTIKIDSVPAFAAFNRNHPDPRKPAPSVDACEQEAADMSSFFDSVWEVSPTMKFIVEATAVSEEELERVAIDACDPRVSFQGCHLHDRAVLVCQGGFDAGSSLKSRKRKF
jgi:hypothetical protein